MKTCISADQDGGESLVTRHCSAQSYVLYSVCLFVIHARLLLIHCLVTGDEENLSGRQKVSLMKDQLITGYRYGRWLRAYDL